MILNQVRGVKEKMPHRFGRNQGTLVRESLSGNMLFEQAGMAFLKWEVDLPRSS